MISVVIPVFNEEQGIRILHDRLTACAATWNEDYEFVVVDDGSHDDTFTLLQGLANRDPHLKLVSLSRNFGHQAAVTAGLDFARGNLVAIIDADLQDPPEELPRFFAKCREGFDVVYGIRTKRKEGLFKRLGYYAFYRILAKLASINIPLDSGDFCVLSRRAVDALATLPERNRFIRGLRSWIGLPQIGLAYERQARLAGEPKYTLAKLLNLALAGIVNFSSRPLRLIALLGVFLAFFVLGTAGFVFIQYVTDWTVFSYNPRHAKGWTSTILAVLFLSSVQLTSLGIIGEYLARVFEEIKQRPIYLVGRTANTVPPRGDALAFRERTEDDRLPSAASAQPRTVPEEVRSL